ncbi:hypothetical protein Ancab_014715 [Ancistrocladus abbreviatus]
MRMRKGGEKGEKEEGDKYMKRDSRGPVFGKIRVSPLSAEAFDNVGAYCNKVFYGILGMGQGPNSGSLIRMPPPMNSLGSDGIRCALDLSGVLFIRSTYAFIQGDKWTPKQSIRNRGWKWEGGCFHSFWWLAMSGKQLTNLLRERRKLTHNDLCPWCPQTQESALHVLHEY